MSRVEVEAGAARAEVAVAVMRARMESFILGFGWGVGRSDDGWIGKGVTG